MSSYCNLGNTIQTMLNNTPTVISANDTTTSVVTNGGNVYQAGLIGGKIQSHFREVITNENIIGKVISIKSTQNKNYMLNDNGSVFEYDYNAGTCGPIVREIYSPSACNGDKAKKISTGRAHVLILTEGGKTWGAGDNSQYQLVPQGQCKYDSAVELIITDTNVHDNGCDSRFSGNYNELECPIIPKQSKCEKVSCIKKESLGKKLGFVSVQNLPIQNIPGVSGIQLGTLNIPVTGDINYVGFLCTDGCKRTSGTINYNINNLYIACGCIEGTFVYTVNNNQVNIPVKLYNNNSIALLSSVMSGSSLIENVDCGFNFILNINASTLVNFNTLPVITVTDVSAPTPSSLNISVNAVPVSVINFSCSVLNIDSDFSTPATLVYALSKCINIDCCGEQSCTPCPVRQETKLPQPCWTGVYAGFDVSVLVDSCNRVYALGSLHNVRNNGELLEKSCLKNLFNGTNASINFPASQLNCPVSEVRGNCICNDSDKPFKTDLSKFGINVSFPGENGCSNSVKVCDFLDKLKNCNDSPTCGPICQPCDSYIYLNMIADGDCFCEGSVSRAIGSVTLWNRISVCKYVSQCEIPDVCCLDTDCDSTVEFDINTYCVDARNLPLDKVLKLNFCNSEGPNVDLFIDIDTPEELNLAAVVKNLMSNLLLTLKLVILELIATNVVLLQKTVSALMKLSDALNFYSISDQFLIQLF